MSKAIVKKKTPSIFQLLFNASEPAFSSPVFSLSLSWKKKYLTFLFKKQTKCEGPALTPFSPFVNTGFLLSSPWDKNSHFLPIFQCQLQPISFYCSLITVLWPHLLMCHSHFQSCSGFLSRNHPLQSLLPCGLQDPTPSNTNSFQNTKTTDGCKKSHPPPIANPFCRAISAFCFQHHQPIAPLSLPCEFLAWELPRHIVLANHLKWTTGSNFLVLYIDHRPPALPRSPSTA